MTHVHLSCRAMILATLVVLLSASLSFVGCSKVTGPLSRANRSWYDKFGWHAEDYFDDPKVIALCEAIQNEDLAEIDRLVAAGADINALGKGKMTPLLWAFPENKLEVFKRILEHGADPNVHVEDDFGTKMSGIVPGDSVTHLAAETWFPNYFKYVMQHGGDPNLVDPQHRETPLFSVIKGHCTNKREAVQLLIDAGADLDDVRSGATPAMAAVSWFGQYGLTLQLLEAGADHEIYRPDSNQQLVHLVVREQRRKPYWSAEQKSDYDELVAWLNAQGVSFEKAKADNAHWKEEGKLLPAQIRAVREREVKERIRREEAEKARQNAVEGEREKGE
ncbi:MAG: hypothetical protein GXX96_24330 [Planctomycetaceae bacterium]|nr:hypothetical protein [Planctomycetaceae bacterium]